MYISSIGKKVAISHQSFGKLKMADNVYEVNIAEDRASIQGLYDISNKLEINKNYMTIMEQFLALSSYYPNKISNKYKISAIATPDLQKPERTSEEPKDIKATLEFDPKDSTHILAMHWAPGVIINYSSHK